MAKVKRRDVGSLLLLIALELGLLCLLAARCGGSEHAARGAAPVSPLSFDRLGPEAPPVIAEGVPNDAGSARGGTGP